MACVAICHARERFALWDFIDRRAEVHHFAERHGHEMHSIDEQSIYPGAAREKMANIAIEMADGKGPKFTHCLFIDADSFPPEEGLVALLNRDVDVVSGLYFKRSLEADPVVYLREEDTLRTEMVSNRFGYRAMRDEIAKLFNDNSIPLAFGPILVGDIGEDRPDLIEVDCVGAGFLLVSIDVLKACNNWSHEGHVGEDILWCERVKDAGYKIWLDWGVIVGHISTMALSTAWFQLSGQILENAKKKRAEDAEEENPNENDSRSFR